MPSCRLKCPSSSLTSDSLLFSQPAGPGAGFPSDRKGKARALPDDPNSKDFLALDLDGDRGENGVGAGQGGYQQMQLVEQNVSCTLRSLVLSPAFLCTAYRCGALFSISQ